MVFEEKLPEGSVEGVSYRRVWDGSPEFYAGSIQYGLCLYCGKWYHIDEVHGKIMGGCEAAPLPV